MHVLYRGFTFIELLIVIGTIGVLAAVAIPAYHDYLWRAQASEAMRLALPLKKAVADYYAYHGVFPADNRAAGVASAPQLRGTYVARLAIADGQIQAFFFAPELSGRLDISPASDYPGQIYWRCASADIPARYLPSPCK